MAHISVVADDVELADPILVEGFPGVGLVGKLAADHLAEHLDLRHYANVHCESLPRVAVYEADSSDVSAPVRLYTDDDGELLVLQSDVPIDPEAAEEFADCFTPWIEANATPIFVAGKPTQDRDGTPQLFGVATSGAREYLERAGLDTPTERGAVSGPTGALLAQAVEKELPAVGLVVESDPQFPDPIAAQTILAEGVTPITGIEVQTQPLVDQAEEIQEAKGQLAQQMGEADEQSTKATPLRMYQ